MECADIFLVLYAVLFINIKYYNLKSCLHSYYNDVQNVKNKIHA